MSGVGATCIQALYISVLVTTLPARHCTQSAAPVRMQPSLGRVGLSPLAGGRIIGMLAGCIFTEWRGISSPLKITHSSSAVVRNTMFRNADLPVVVADVSYGSTVQFYNVSFAGVTLTYGRVVGTTGNDYADLNCAPQPSSFWTAEHDEGYDADWVVMPPEERRWGEEFVIRNSTMSDCLYLLTPESEVLPGCPGESAVTRRKLIEDMYSSEDALVASCSPAENRRAWQEWFTASSNDWHDMVQVCCCSRVPLSTSTCWTGVGQRSFWHHWHSN